MKIILILIFTILSFGQLLAQRNISTVKIGDNISLTATIESFDSSKHTYDTCDTGLGWSGICLIDGEPWFGCDNGMDLPRNQLVKLSIKINGKDILLDVGGMFNPSYNNEIKKEQFEIENGEFGYYLYGYFSDAAGSYTVQWIIIKGKSMRLKIFKEC